MHRCVISCNSRRESACMPDIYQVIRHLTDVCACRKRRPSHFSKPSPPEPRSTFLERRPEAASIKPIIPPVQPGRTPSRTSVPIALSGIFSACRANAPIYQITARETGDPEIFTHEVIDLFVTVVSTRLLPPDRWSS